jgi:hypothetical protein
LIQDAAVRELIEEAGPASQRGPLQPQFLKDCITGWRVFDNPKRAARGRVITIAYVFELPSQQATTPAPPIGTTSTAWIWRSSLRSTVRSYRRWSYPGSLVGMGVLRGSSADISPGPVKSVARVVCPLKSGPP